MSRRGRRHAHYPGSGEDEPWLISGVPREWAVALLAGPDLPYALVATVRSSSGQIICPAHLRCSWSSCTRPAGPGGDTHRYQRVRHDRLGRVRRNCPASEILLGVSLG